MTVTAETANTVQVGDFFYVSWGYDQTQVNFFKVVGVTASGKSVKVQEWSSAYAEDGSGTVAGDQVVQTWQYHKNAEGNRDYTRDSFKTDAPVQTYRLRHWGSEPSFRWTSFAHAYKWSGKSLYETPFGFGH